MSASYKTRPLLELVSALTMAQFSAVWFGLILDCMIYSLVEIATLVNSPNNVEK